MDEDIDNLLLLANSYTLGPIPETLLLSQGISERAIQIALRDQFVQRVNGKLELQEKGYSKISALKLQIRKTFPKQAKEYSKFLENNGRIMPPKMRYAGSFSQIICPICNKLNLGSRYAFEVCQHCDAKITEFSTRRNKLRHFFFSFMKWNRWVKFFLIVAAIMAFLASLFAVLQYVEDHPGLFGNEKSNIDYLKIDISSKNVFEKRQYVPIPVIDVFNPAVQDNDSQLNLWLTNENDKSSIFVKAVEIIPTDFSYQRLDDALFEIKPGQTHRIPLLLTPLRKVDYLYLETRISYTLNNKPYFSDNLSIIAVAR